MTTQAYPLAWPTGWPRAANRKRAKFSKSEEKRTNFSDGSSRTWRESKELSIHDATKRILAELHTFGVPSGEAIISTNLELRLDGLPRSNQSAPADPGVAVYWRRGSDPTRQTKVMAIDIYDRVADNLAAVAATLNAMRAIERHGGAQILERAFTGFTALADRSNWRTILKFPPAPMRPTLEQLEARFRMLAKEAHADVGGNHEAMTDLNIARDQAKRELGYD